MVVEDLVEEVAAIVGRELGVPDQPVDLPDADGLDGILAVIHTEPGLKGDTASSTALKPAEVETGAKVMVPLFIEMGEKIRISTADGSYVERVR